MKKLLVLLMIMASKLAFSIDPDDVRAAYKRLNLEITADKEEIEKQYRSLVSSEGSVASFSKETRNFRDARNLILEFINAYDVSILLDANQSRIFKKERLEENMTLEQRYVVLFEDNATRLKSAFTAPYSGSEDWGYDDMPRRPIRNRETIYPAYYEINTHYKEMLNKEITNVDLNVYSDILDLQIHSKISFIKELKEFYPQLSNEGKEMFSIMASIMADEGTRLDLQESPRMNYFLYRMNEAKEISSNITADQLETFKSLYAKMDLQKSGIDNQMAPFYFDTLSMLNEVKKGLKLPSLAPKDIDQKYFLYHGVLAPFFKLKLTPKQNIAMEKLNFQLAALLKKDLGENEVIIANYFEEEKKRYAIILELAEMIELTEDSVDIYNLGLDELLSRKAEVIREGKVSCVDLLSLFMN